MNTYIKILISIIVLFAGVYLSDLIFISRTEGMIWSLYLVISVVVFWNSLLDRLYFIFAAILFSLAVFLFVAGSILVRYVHYIDKASVWSYYFFATGLLISLFKYLKERKKRK